MDMLETAVRDGDGRLGEVYVPRYLRFLAAQALLCIPPNVFPDARPAEFAGNQSDCRLYPWMGDPVEGGHNRLAESRWNQRPKSTGRDVSKQLYTSDFS
jgi:hypothetical protein